jgi:dipeptidyl aminopeptidase/acylaminoacyl peptidase
MTGTAMANAAATTAGSLDAGAPLSLVEMMEIPQLAAPRLCPLGRKLLYLELAPDWAAKRSCGHIFVLGLAPAGGAPVQLTSGAGGERTPLWSPDGAAVAFIAKRAGDTSPQVYVISATGGEARRLTDGAEGVGSLSDWAADGHIYFSGRAAPAPEAKPTRFRVPASDSPYAFEEPGFLQQTLVCRVHAEAACPAVVEKLTPDDCTAYSHSLSPDGKTLLWHRTDSTLLDAARSTHSVWLQPTGGGGADGAQALPPRPVPLRADNSRGPGGPMGPLRTPLRTPGTLSRPSISHCKPSRDPLILASGTFG